MFLQCEQVGFTEVASEQNPERSEEWVPTEKKHSAERGASEKALGLLLVWKITGTSKVSDPTSKR